MALRSSHAQKNQTHAKLPSQGEFFEIGFGVNSRFLIRAPARPNGTITDAAMLLYASLTIPGVSS
ncbi:hypothetical protein CHELA1G2_20219 [Hyphomicrobiales bacterium]|nr:hypothetical protein CHELA1G2_20219 [Hyphomicrobiales bacterium]